MKPSGWKNASSAAELIQELAAHRLLPVYDLLVERGLIRSDVAPIAASLSEKARKKTAAQSLLEEFVLEALGAAAVDLLILKGALLGRTVYGSPELRLRTDLDVLVSGDKVEDVGQILCRLGYSPKHPIPSGIPMNQRSFVGEFDGIQHGVDVHWDLSQRSVLKRRIPFEDLWSRRRAVTGLPANCFGLSCGDAILHSAMHYFAHYERQALVDQWILDIDLVWRQIAETERERVCERAKEYHIASLLGKALQIAVDTFETPAAAEQLSSLEQTGKQEAARYLLEFRPFGFNELLNSALKEPKRSDGVRMVFRTFFPTVSYMRFKWPSYPSWALPWLYLRRLGGGGSELED